MLRAVLSRRGLRPGLFVVCALLLGSTLAPGEPPFVVDPRCPGRLLDVPAPGAYPWQAVADPMAADAYGFTARQCTSFVAWYLNARGLGFARRIRGPAGVAQFDDAGQWDAAALRAGYTVSATPTVGSIAEWHAGEVSPNGCMVAGKHGHVAVVVAVHPDGTVDTVAYNGTTRQFDAETGATAPRYIVFAGVCPKT